MKCADCREDLIEAARGWEVSPPVAIHARNCASCGRFLEAQTKLSAAMHGLREGAKNASLILPILPSRQRAAWRLPAVAAAVAALLLIFLLARRPVSLPPAPPRSEVLSSAVRPEQPAPLPPPATPHARKARRPRPSPAVAEFISVPFTVPLSPGERTEVRRVEMPVAALIAAGMPISVGETGSLARADVVVGADGRARAFRLISISQNEERTIYK